MRRYNGLSRSSLANFQLTRIGRRPCPVSDPYKGVSRAARPENTRLQQYPETLWLQENVATPWKSARLRPRSRSPARRSGEPDAESRVQSLDGDFDVWPSLEKARRLDDGDRRAFDDRYPVPDRALCFPGQRKFLKLLTLYDTREG